MEETKRCLHPLVPQRYDREFRITHLLKKKYLELYRLPTWAAVR